jgi:DNA-binding NarL/FixJ family response regulator
VTATEAHGSPRVVLVDDAPLFRAGVAALLSEQGIAVVAQLGDASPLRDAVDRHEADVAVLDVRMPPTFTTEGLEAARGLRRTRPGVGVLVLSQYAETRHAISLLRGSGAGVGYLLKERVSNAEHLADAIRRVGAGGTAVDPDLVRTALGASRAVDALTRLTTREHDVLELMAQGLSNPAIARTLSLTSKTVETHVRHIFTKLDLPADPDQERRVLAVLTSLQTS